MKRLVLILALTGLCISNVEAQKKLPAQVNICNESPIRRTEIILPQVKGFNCYKADLHVHTSYSDGAVTPAGRVNEAWYDGLDILAITDHLESHSGVKKFFKVAAPYNKNGKPTRYTPPGSTIMPKNGIDPGLKVDFNAIHQEAERANKNKGYNLLLIKGCEMARNKEKLGHYNALFVSDLNAIYNFDLKEAFKNVKSQGGLVIHNHPGLTDRYETEWHAECRKEGLIDGIEVVNGLRYYPPMVKRCIDEKLFMVGCTDTHDVTDHRYTAVGCFRTMTIIFAKECTEEAIKEALIKRRSIAYSGGDLIGEEEWLKEFFNASIHCQLIKKDKKNDTRTFSLTNMSSITYELRRGKTVIMLEPFKTTTLTWGKDKESGKLSHPRLRVDNMWIVDHKHPYFDIEIDKK